MPELEQEMPGLDSVELLVVPVSAADMSPGAAGSQLVMPESSKTGAF